MGKVSIDRRSIGRICVSVLRSSNMLTPQSSVESVYEEPCRGPSRAASSWSLLRHRIRAGGHQKSPGGTQLSSLIKLAGQERSKRSAQSLKESQTVLTLEIHRLRERVRDLESQLAANQHVVTDTQHQLHQLFQRVQHIDAQFHRWPLDATVAQPFQERQRHEFLLSQVLDQIRNGNYRLRRVGEGRTAPLRVATIADPKINKCPLVQEIEAVRVAMKRKTAVDGPESAPENENSNASGRCLATPERHLLPQRPLRPSASAANIKKHIQRTFDSQRN